MSNSEQSMWRVVIYVEAWVTQVGCGIDAPVRVEPVNISMYANKNYRYGLTREYLSLCHANK
jgi:hypothetical protein